jgi:hypothetical protein
MGPVLPQQQLPERWTNPITGIGPDGNAVGAGGVMSPTGDLSTGDLTIGDLSTGDLSTGDLTIGVVNGGSAVRSCPCYKIAIPTRQDSLLFTDVPGTDPQFSHTSSGPAPSSGSPSRRMSESCGTGPPEPRPIRLRLKRYSHARRRWSRSPYCRRAP